LDHRAKIVEAGLQTLREHGYAGFTQPRVAALAGLRQSHLTYYHPTRLDLLAAVGRAAVDQQLVAVAATFAKLSSLEDAARAIADLVTRHENTRILMALAQAGDQEPRLREMFRELADGIVAQAMLLLERIGNAPNGEESARLLHAVSVGLAVVDLATGRPDGKQRAVKVLKTVLPSIIGTAKPSGATPRKRRRSTPP
jgi:AcrR family transcriptional regulator